MKWRMKNSAISALWYDVENAVRYAVQHPGEKVVINDKLVCKVASLSGTPTLLLRLPSGRYLIYYGIHIAHDPQGKDDKGVLTFWGVDNRQGSPTQGQWAKITTYGGKLVENLTQAIARDIMGAALVRLEEANLPVVLHVHDEAVPEVERGSDRIAEFSRIMTILPAWAKGFPVAVKAETALRYKK